MKKHPFLFVLIFTAILFRPCCSYAQLGVWWTNSIEELYGHTVYINSLMDKTQKDAASLTLIEKKLKSTRNSSMRLIILGASNQNNYPHI